MNTNEYGQVVFETQEILSMLYAGQDIAECSIQDMDELLLHHKHSNLFEIDNLLVQNKPEQPAYDYHSTKSSDWQMPNEYKTIDLDLLLSRKLISKGLNQAKYTQRITDEMTVYREKNMLDLLKFLHYLINICSQHDIITGIGRGSSVSSLVLHLLDVHHIDPVKYNLDYKEFLR